MFSRPSVCATREEKTRSVPGDERIPQPIDTLTHAVTIRGAPRDVWPWLVQMGAGTRAGWYSYDWLDNGRQPSATRIVPALQHPEVGAIFPALPEARDGFTLLAIEPERVLTLGWVAPDGTLNVTWTFVLDKIGRGLTRLVVRVRGGAGYRLYGLPLPLTRLVVRIVHFIMQRKQLLGIARRVENASRSRRERSAEAAWGRTMNPHARAVLKWTASALGVAAGAYVGYVGYVGLTWLRYGHVAPAGPDADPLLHRFIPVYDVAERHHVHVAARPAITFAAACEQDLMASPVARTIFRAREILLGSEPETAEHPRGLLPWMKSIGWGVLAEVSGREIVMGAVTQPWHANVVFRPLPPDEFVAFDEPDYVKIVWTLRADPDGTRGSIFRTDTRVFATDATARAKFRRYWSFLSPGIILIRRASLRPLKREAERRARERS